MNEISQIKKMVICDAGSHNTKNSRNDIFKEINSRKFEGNTNEP